MRRPYDFVLIIYIELSLFDLFVFAMFFSCSFLPSKEKQRVLVNIYIQLNVKTKKDVCFPKCARFFEFHLCTRSANNLR